MPVPAVDAAVVGGGPVGLALALGLAAQGRTVQLLERGDAPGDSAGGRMLALGLGAWRFLQSVDGWPEDAHPYRALEVWDGLGGGRVRFDAADAGCAQMGAVLPYHSLRRRLWQRAAAHDGLQLRANAAVEDARAGDCSWQLQCSDGAQLRCAMLCLSDGGAGDLRRRLGLARRSCGVQLAAVAAMVHLHRHHEDTAWQCFLADGPLALLPLAAERGHHRCALVWTAPQALATELMALPAADFAARADAAMESRPGRIVRASHRQCAPVFQQYSRRITRHPPLALLGDSARRMYPLAGQGANQGLLDARDLCAAMAGCADADAALRLYRRRLPSGLAMLAAMEGFTRLFGDRPLPLLWARNQGLRWCQQAPWVKARIMRHAMGLDGFAADGHRPGASG